MNKVVLHFLKSENGLSATSYVAILAVTVVGYVVACHFLLG